MKRPLAYITAAWFGGDSENAELAAQYCRAVYEAGFAPMYNLFKDTRLQLAFTDTHAKLTYQPARGNRYGI